MKHNKYPQNKKPAPVETSPATASADSNQGEADFVPAPDEVARKAYFAYVNQGSRPGHEVQHWLAAEAELIAERNLTRVHGFNQRA